MKIVIATENKDKLEEIQSFLTGLPLELISQSEFNIKPVEETGLSFIENAILKARHCAKHTELPSIADDSGLAVEALGGAPGIYSARYAGPKANAKDNMDKLLNSISSLEGEDRRAKFYCVIAFVRHFNDPVPVICQAQWEGKILKSPVGDGGFGYDPVFFIPNLNCTAAELAPEQKNQISHRAKALSEFCKQLSILYPSEKRR